MTDPQYIAWLTDPKAIRIVLIEAGVRSGGSEITRYLTTGAYVTGAADTPPNQFYMPKAVANVTTPEALSLTNEASLNIGDVEIYNGDGVLDSWMLDIWTNRPIQAFIGDPRWPRADFRMIFNGVIADIGSKSRDKLNLKLRDKLQRLNTAVTETKLSDIITDSVVLATLSNKDAIVPTSLGEQHNITPVLTNPATLEYMVHNGPINGIIEARDNGIPVAIIANNATGRFTLSASPAGAVTVSVQGDKPSTYTNTVAGLVQRLVTGYGKASDRFVTGDLDTTSLATFDTAHPQPVGLPLLDRTNVLNACQQLASSIGAQICMTRLGKLRLVQIDLASPVSTFDIRPHQMLDRELTPISREPVVASIKLGFCKNWTLQPGLLTSLSAADKEFFNTEWLTSTAVDATVQSTYKLSADPVQIDTMLLRRVDADPEATRLLNLRKVPRTTYQFTGFAEMLQLELGQIVTIYHPRFNLAAGGVGMVVSLAPSWANGRVVVGVLI